MAPGLWAPDRPAPALEHEEAGGSGLTPEHWQRVKKLLQGALERPDEERAAFLASACAGDAALQRQVESLIVSHEEAQSFLERPVVGPSGEAGARNPMIGETLGHYRIDSQLGAGGMGVVYGAWDTRLHRTVALKLLRDSADPAARRRLLQEARAASALNHPGICTVYEVGEEGQQAFIVMEHVEGRPLNELIPREGLAVPTALRYGLQIADALAHAHERGIVHRDLKPSNVVITPQDRAKVLDFGLAKRLGGEVTAATTRSGAPLTQPGTVIGTLPYMAPEQLRGRHADARSDVWALGVLLYEMTAGAQPFRGQTEFELSSAILNEAPVPLASPLPRELAGLDALLSAMLAKDPRLRPTVAEAVTLLAGLSEGRISAKVAPPDREGHRTVGRERQKAALQSAFEHVDVGRGLMLCVTGEPGIGKTAIVEEFLSALAAGPVPCAIARGRCSERLAGAEAYLPWLEALDALLAAAPAEAVRLMRAVAPNWATQLAPVEGATAEPPTAAQQPASQERLKRELTAFLHEVTKRRPLVLFFDDVHWADASTVDLVGYLAGRFDALRILVIVTYRPTEMLLSKHPFALLKLDLEGRGACRELPLDFLGREDIDEYLSIAFPGHRFPASLGELVLAKTEGNPLFVVDLLRYLRDRGVLAQEQDVWTLTRPLREIEGEVPVSVRSMIQRKLEQLHDADRRLLAIASVQGYDFDSAVVADGVKAESADVEERLEALERIHAFVRRVCERDLPDRTPSVRYRFVHVLYQNAFYASLGPGRRAALSLAVAEALTAHYPGRRVEIATDLALLFEAGRDAARAAEHFQLAAEHAERILAHHEALVLARRGLEVLKSVPEDPSRNRTALSLNLTLGRALMATKGWSAAEVEEVFARAKELCVSMGDTSQLFPVLCGSLAFNLVGANFRAAHRVGEELLRLARESGDPVLLIHAHYGLGDILTFQGEFAAALAQYDQSIELCDRTDLRYLPLFFGQHPAVASRSGAAGALAVTGYPKRALGKSCEALALAESLSHPFSVAFVLWTVCLVHCLYRDWPAMLENGQAMLSLSEEHGFAFWASWGTFMRGRVVAEGDAAAGIAQMRQGLRGMDAAGARLHRTMVLAWLTEALGRAGLTGEALCTIEEALRLARDRGEGFYQAELFRIKGELLLMQAAEPSAEVDRQAEACFREAIEIARRQDAKWWQLRATVSMSRLYQRSGRTAEARDMLAAIYGRFTEGLDTADLRDARTLLGDLGALAPRQA